MSSLYAFAGLVSNTGAPLPEDARRALLRTMALSDLPVRSSGDESVLVANLETDALGIGPTLRDDGRAIAVLAGEPLFAEGAARTTSALEQLACALSDGDDGALGGARGTFAGAWVQRGTEGRPPVLRLVVDAVGARPLYLVRTPAYSAFSTSRRWLLALPQVPRDIDGRGLAERLSLRYSLGSRTIYRAVESLRGAELVECEAGRVRRRTYRTWPVPDGGPPPDDTTALEREVYERFVDAVARRARDDDAAVAFLSGGLDSRVIVATLRALGRRVRSFNFSPPRSQDGLLGRAFAEAAGCVHVERPNVDAFPDWSAMMRRALETEGLVDAPDVPRPLACWSGDGGSVSLGHVYLTRDVVAALRRGDENGAISAYLHALGARVPTRVIRRSLRAEMRDALVVGVREELQRIDVADPVRRFHRFLMANDQRRHLKAHFEIADRHGIELQLPFFDPNLLDVILGAPGEPFLYHRFYVRWMQQFPRAARSVPWQSYPTHEPCPLPMPSGLSGQWDTVAADDAGARARRARAVDAARRALQHEGLHRDVLATVSVRIALLVHTSGLRDQSYTLDAAGEIAELLHITH